MKKEKNQSEYNRRQHEAYKKFLMRKKKKGQKTKVIFKEDIPRGYIW